MRNILLVIKHEIITTLSKRSFWLTTFVLPLAIMAFSIAPQIMAQDSFGDLDNPLAAVEGPQALGYVDQAGILQSLPPGIPAGALLAYPDEAAAQSAQQAGQIGAYYLIPAGFLASGDVTLVDGQFSFVNGEEQALLLEYAVNYNLVGVAGLGGLLIDPTHALNVLFLAPRDTASPDESDPVSFFAPFAIMFILFFTITMSAGYMLQSVAQEKENRTAEVLLLSLRPAELMLGKVLGLGCVALLQMGIWLGGSATVLNRGQSMLPVASNFQLPSSFIAWAVLYFILGYLLYSSALGALGALAPNVREGSQFTFFFLLPLMIPLWLNTAFIQSPNGPLATALSLFPLTAPTSMITRLAAGGVPGWQPLVSLIGLAGATYLFVLLAARFFRADTLLSSASINWRRIWGELRRA